MNVFYLQKHRPLSISKRRAQCCYIDHPVGTLQHWWRTAAICANLRTVTDVDRRYMQRALRLAEKGIGKTFPNPVVGCVIVKDEQVVGEGFHPKAGLPHAEVYALRAAGHRAHQATAYVTLEPCNHYGSTPPCSKALIAAGIARVVIGITDPYPLVSGAGIKTLNDAGIEVIEGCLQEECFKINKEFMKRMTQED